MTEDDIKRGLGANAVQGEIPVEWKSGKLFQMLFANRNIK